MFIIEKKQGCHIDLQYGAKNDLSVIRSQMLKRLLNLLVIYTQECLAWSRVGEIVTTQRGLLKPVGDLAGNGRERVGTPRPHCSCVMGPDFSLQDVLNLFPLIHCKMYK